MAYEAKKQPVASKITKASESSYTTSLTSFDDWVGLDLNDDDVFQPEEVVDPIGKNKTKKKLSLSSASNLV